MPDEAASPTGKAYGLVRSRTSQERAEQQALAQASKEFEDSPASHEIDKLRKELEQVQKDLKQVRGEGGIEVFWPTIRLRQSGTAGGDTTSAENVGSGAGVNSKGVLIVGSNVQAKMVVGHSDGSVTISEGSDTSGKWLIFQATPGVGNSYPVAVHDCDFIGGPDVELTPAVTRLKFIGRLLENTEPTPNIVHVTANLKSGAYEDLYRIDFTGGGVDVVHDGLGALTVTIAANPQIAVHKITPAGGTDTELTPNIAKLKFEGRLFTVTEPVADLVKVLGDLRVGESGGSEYTDIFKILFVGATVSESSGVATVTVTASGSALTIKDEGLTVTTAATSLDFKGRTIAATGAAAAIITVEDHDYRWNVNGAATLVAVASKIIGSP